MIDHLGNLSHLPIDIKETKMEPLSLFDENEVPTEAARELRDKISDAVKPIVQEFVREKGYKSREVEGELLSTIAVKFSEYRLITAAERRKAKKQKKAL